MGSGSDLFIFGEVANSRRASPRNVPTLRFKGGMNLRSMSQVRNKSPAGRNDLHNPGKKGKGKTGSKIDKMGILETGSE